MSNFFVNQSLSVNQRRNPRLNEYFAVVGLPDGPLQLADPPPNAAPVSGGSPGPAPLKASATATVDKLASAVDGADGRSVGEGPVGEKRSGEAPARGSSSSNHSTSASKSSNTTACTSELNSTSTSTSSSNNATTEAAAAAAAAEASGAPFPSSSTTSASNAPPRPGGDTLLPAPLARLGSVQARRRTYGSCELGIIRAKAADAGWDGPLYSRFRARVLHRFPGYDHEGDGCAFPANLPLFCLPGGLKLSLEMALPTFFTFVHTRANGQHMFGYCLCLHEPLEKRHRLELQKLVDAHNKAGDWGKGREQTGSAELLGALDSEREVYAPKCLCLLSTWPHFGPFREWLLNLYRISLSPFQIPLERYIGNFLLEVPTPSPGRVEVLYNMGNTTITFACPPPNKPVTWGSVPFEPLFKCLSHENILTLFSCLLLERSILLKSSQLSLLTPCAEVLALVMYPLSWSHVYIPVLPEALLGVLAAPMPFLIGVHRSFVEHTELDVAPYVVQVDLDSDIVEMGLDSPIPALPSRRRAKLLSKLGEHAQLSHCRTPEYRQDVMEKSDLAFSMAIRPCDFDDDEIDAQLPDWDAVREAFLRFFVALLGGYRRCLVYPTKANPNPVRLFNVDDFVDKLERDSRPFTEAVCDTQAFQNFIDARIQPEAGDLDVVFFDACIAAKRNRSLLHVTKKSDANFLRPDTFVKAKTVFALTPDITGLNMDAPPKSHDRFPSLSMALYPIPRDIPSLSNPTNHDSGGATKRRSGGGNSGGSGNNGGSGNGGSSAFNKYFGVSRKGDGEGTTGSGGDGGGSGGGGRRGSTSLSGGRGVFTRGASSRGGDDDWNPLSAEATVFAVFLVGFCATIGVEPPAAKRGAGPLSSVSSPAESAPPPPPFPHSTAAATAHETAGRMPPALEVTTPPESSAVTSTSSVPAQGAACTASRPTTPELDTGAADGGAEGTDAPATSEEDDEDDDGGVLGLRRQERGPAEVGDEEESSLTSSWCSGSGPEKAPAASDAGGALSAVPVPPPLAIPAGWHAPAAASDKNKGEPVAGSGGHSGDTLAEPSAQSSATLVTAGAATPAPGLATLETEVSGPGEMGAAAAAPTDAGHPETPQTALGAGGDSTAAPEVGPPPKREEGGGESVNCFTAGEQPLPTQPAQTAGEAGAAAAAGAVGSAPGVAVESGEGGPLPVEVETAAVQGATASASLPLEDASVTGSEGRCGASAGGGNGAPAPAPVVQATATDGVLAAGAVAPAVEGSPPPPLTTAQATPPAGGARIRNASGEGGDDSPANRTSADAAASAVGGSRVQEIPAEVAVAAGAVGVTDVPSFSVGLSSGSASASPTASAKASFASSSSSLAAPPALLPALSVTSVPIASPVAAVTDAPGAGEELGKAAAIAGAAGNASSDGRGGKTRKSSRLAFSELKHDVREERLYKANAALAVAFEALEAMREKAPGGEEAVYRSLISACGRCGNSEKAMAVVEMMMSTGIVPDAMVSRCLVDAFAMDDSFSDGGAHPLSLLDWSKFQPKHRDGRRSHESSGRPSSGSDSSFSFRRMMRRFNDKSDTTSPAPSPSLAAIAAEPAPPATTSTTTTFTAKAAAGSVVLSPFDTPTRPPSYAAVMGVVSSGRAALATSDDGGESRKASTISDVGSASGVSRARDSFGMYFDSPDGHHSPLFASLERGRRAVAAESEENALRRSTDLRRRLGRSASPYSRRGGMSVEMQQQVLLGERLLESVFPELKIENVSETCPACQAELSGEQVRDGWSSDPNDYTTECRAVVDLQAAALAAAGASAGAGWGGGGGGGDGAGTSGAITASGSGGGGGTGASAVLSASRGGSAAGGGGATGRRRSSTVGLSASKAKGASVVCGRRFVSRFSVHSTAAGWEGTTGPGTPLWCEYLSPWVLRKEFHTILAAYGVQYLCSERFRQGLGPAEDATDPAGGGRFSLGGDGVGGTGQRAAGISRAVDRTVFWNLVMHFREHCLPITFLLADATSTVGPVLMGSTPDLVAAE